jgi:hypothetical protein
MSKRNVILGGLLAMAIWAVGGCSKETEVRSCNPGTVLVHFVCSEALGEVDATAALEGLAGQMTTKAIKVTCPGEYNLEVSVTGYEKGGKIKAVVSANAGDLILAKDKLVEIPLNDGCTKFDLMLASSDGSKKLDAAVVINEGDGGTKPLDGVDGGVTPDADMTSLGVARGGSCARDEQCTDGHCADGVCCDKACDGVCMACTIEKTDSPTGQCALTKAGVKHSKCAAKTANTCETTGMCNGAGVCSFWDSTNECVAAKCNGGDYVPAQKCNGAGACQPATLSKCEEYACTAQGCKTGCTVAGDCSAGVQCINGKCGGKRALGEACLSNGECTNSAFCVDGVCCGAKCDGKCESCLGAVTGGKNGECLPVPASKGKQDDCEAMSALSCGTTGRCDGARKCEFHASGTTCAAQMCSGATQTSARVCDGGGNCLMATSMECAPGTCDVAAKQCRIGCVGGDSQCIVGAYCDGNACFTKKGAGVKCGRAGECSSNFCADGKCCNQACNGPTETCSAGGSCRATYSIQTYIKASNANPAYRTEFGRAVAASGNTIVVGDPSESSAAVTVNGSQVQSSGSSLGAAYVFVRSGTTWSQQAYLKGSEGVEYASFGSALSLEGDTLAVAQPGSNKIYIFSRSGTTWSETSVLSPTFNGKNAGSSLSLSGDYLAAGDSGANKVHIFRKTFGVWRYEQTLKAPGSSSAEQFEDYGLAVTLKGTRLIVGAPKTSFAFGSEYRPNAGAFVWYERDASNSWQQKSIIHEPMGENYARFGSSVTTSGDSLFVGAIDYGNPLSRGAVHLYTLVNNTWIESKKVEPPAGRLFESLGSGTFPGRLLAATAPFSGLLYLYKRDATNLTDVGQLSPTGSRAGEGFSAAIAGTDDFIVVGAEGDQSTGQGVNPPHNAAGEKPTGAIYVLE